MFQGIAEGINRFHLEARIVPEAAELGTVVNIWMGAKLPNGQIYLRESVPASVVSNNQAGGYDNWLPMPLGDLPPTVTGFKLEPDNQIVVVQWRNLAELAGVDVYLAYGESPANWKLQKLCTVPNF